MKKYLLLCLLASVVLPAYGASDKERIAQLEQQVARLTEQVNILLAANRLPLIPHQNTNEIHICTIRAFTSVYRAENTNRGRAKLDVLEQCTQSNDQMFCKEKDVRCETYR